MYDNDLYESTKHFIAGRQTEIQKPPAYEKMSTGGQKKTKLNVYWLRKKTKSSVKPKQKQKQK